MAPSNEATSIEDGKKASRLDPRQLIQRAIRASGKGVKTGRVTSSFIGDDDKGNAALQIKKLFQQYAPLSYGLPWEMLDYVELLATYNPDYSQAVENIKMLANSGHELFVDADSDLQKKKIKDQLELMARTVQESHGGVDGVINKLLDQGAVFGAMCFRGDTEIITNEGIKKIGDLAGTSVTVMTKSGRWVEAPIRSFGVQSLRKITLRRGRALKEVWATPDHRWLTQAVKGQKSAYSVRPTKGISRSLGTWQVDRQTDELVLGDRLVTVTPDQQAGNLAKTPISPFGVAQGIVFGDGCAPQSRRGITPPAEVGLYGDNVSDLLKFFPLSDTRSMENGVKVVGLPRAWKTDFPAENESASHILGWVAGYFAADGHVTESGTAVLTSRDRCNLEFVRDAFARLGVVCYGIRKKTASGGGVVARGEYEQHVLSFPSGAVPERFFVRPHHALRRTKMNLRDWKVVSVEATDVVEEVFCATVPEFSCFALEGNILTGNCGEWVLDDDLENVIDFVDLSPKKIRFFWIAEEQIYAPHQMVTGTQAKEAEKAGQEVRNNCVRLNPVTFCYYAFDAAPGSPYGTPPFLAALSNIAIQRDIVHNMAQIVKKIGLIGMIDLSIERLDPLPGESEGDYARRAGAYLDEYVEVAEEMVRDGGMVHFDDVTATMQQLGGNAAGATNIHKANEELLFSGLKSMPSVQGRSYSTTETYAGVAYDIIIRNTFKYQNAVKRVIERGYYLQSLLQGSRPSKISLHFNENRSLNRLQEAQAEAAEIKNNFMLWVMGIIDQNDVAQNVGYSQPKTHMDKPPASIDGSAAPAPNPGTDTTTGEGNDNPNAGKRVSDFQSLDSPQGNMEEQEDVEEG